MSEADPQVLSVYLNCCSHFKDYLVWSLDPWLSPLSIVHIHIDPVIWLGPFLRRHRFIVRSVGLLHVAIKGMMYDVLSSSLTSHSPLVLDVGLDILVMHRGLALVFQ